MYREIATFFVDIIRRRRLRLVVCSPNIIIFQKYIFSTKQRYKWSYMPSLGFRVIKFVFAIIWELWRCLQPLCLLLMTDSYFSDKLCFFSCLTPSISSNSNKKYIFGDILYELMQVYSTAYCT